MKLTNEQIAKIASEIIGCEFNYREDWDDIYSKSYRRKFWAPSFTGSERYRSQAFAMVEWLFNHIESLNHADITSKEGETYLHLLSDLSDLVTSKDIDALHQMIWELIDE